MANELFDYADVQQGPADEAGITPEMQSAFDAGSPLLPPDAPLTAGDGSPLGQPTDQAYTPDPFDPFGGIKAAAVGLTPYEELRKRAKKRNPQALDLDWDGSATEALGKEKGMPWDKDTVLGVEVFGEHVSNEQLAQLEGGKELLAIAAQKRNGRRGFFEALSTGSGADFLPYVGDLAAFGVSVKNMAKVRDTFRKMEAGEAVTLQEKVLAKVYEEEAVRQSQSSWLGTAGSIIRTAPAFAVEFMTSGGIFSAAKKGATKAGLLAAKNMSEDFATKATKEGVEKSIYATLRTTPRAALSAENVGVAKIIDNVIQQNPTMAMYRGTMEKTANVLIDLNKNPKRMKAFVDGAIEYAKRGIFDHGDEVMRDLPPGVMGKLREAAGVAFIEAPIKGAMYAALDYGVANPIAAKVMGADEAVTKTEVSLTMAGAAGGDKELMDNAKMLSFGTAVAEYASESSGRAFGALFGIATDYAGAAGRSIARRGIRAADPSVSEEILSPSGHGSFAKKLMDTFFGTEDQLKEGMRGLKREAVEKAVAAATSTEAGMREGAEKLLGKDVVDQIAAGTMTAEHILSGNRALTEKIVTDKMKFMDRPLIGYWVANKMLEKNMTPQKLVKWTQMLGYDGIMGEFMEERYNGFAQGFFGLDGTPDKGFWDRIVKGTQQGFAPGWDQAAAEIFAFALPMVGRAAVSKTFATIGAGAYGNSKNFTDMIMPYVSNGTSMNIETQDGLIMRKEAVATDADSVGVLQGAKKRWGGVNLDATSQMHLANVDDIVDAAAGFAKDLARALEKGETGWTGFLARSATAIAAVVTGGNPIAGGFIGSNPVKAGLIDQFGSREGAMLANQLADAYTAATKNAQADLAAESAKAAEPGEAGGAPKEGSFELAQKRADIEFRGRARQIVTNFMKNHGALMADKASADAWVDEQFKLNAKDGLYAGMTKADFRKKFNDEIIGRAADGTLRFDVVGGRAIPFLMRNPSSNLSEAALQSEAYLSQLGAIPVLDADSVKGTLADRLKLFAGRPIDTDTLMTAAFDDGPKGSQAVHEVVMSGLVSTDGGFAHALRATKDWARALVVGNKSFFRSQYTNAEGATVEVRPEGEGFALYNTATAVRLDYPAFETAEAAETFIAADPAFEKAKSNIWLTPTGAIMTRSASSLLSKERATAEYMSSFAEKGKYENPFLTKGYEAAMEIWRNDMAMAEKYRDTRHEIPAAELEAHREAFERTLGEEGYETLARKHAELRGVRMTRNPAKRGENAYIISNAAMNFGGQMFIPFKAAGSVTAVVEEFVEVASKGKTVTVRVKRTPKNPDGLQHFGIFRDPSDTNTWRRAAREFIIKINTALGHQATLLERSTEESDMRFVREARFLQGMFDHNNYNSEAESHAITAYLYYRGHAALGIGGTASGGSAFYATLGRVADEVMGNKAAFASFMSLANRLDSQHVTGEISDENNFYMRTLGGFAPKSILDQVGITTGQNAQPSTPMQEARAAGMLLADYIERAIKGLPASGLGPAVKDEVSPEALALQDAIKKEMFRLIAQANYKGGDTRMGVTDDVQGYFAEDLPWLAVEAAANVAEKAEIAGAQAIIASWNAAGFVRSAVEARVEAGNSGVVPVEENDQDGIPLSAEDKGEANSLAEDVVATSPAFAVEFARKLAAKQPLLMGGGDPQKITTDDVFNIWQRIDPFLKEEGRAKFKDLLKKKRIVDEAKAEDKQLALSDLFEEGLPEWLAEEDFTDDSEAAGTSFNPDAMARDLAKDMHAVIFSGLSQRWFPQFRGSHSSTRITLAAASRGAGPESVSSLLDSEVWIADGGIHRAFKDAETFEAFLDTANADASHRWQPELKAFFQALGYESSYRFAERVKGAWRRDVVALRYDSDGKLTADYNKASMSAQADRRLRASAYAALKANRDPSDARRALSVLSTGDALVTGLENMVGRDRVPILAKRLYDRMGKIADVVDALVGPGTDFSGALRDPRTSWWTSRELALNWTDETVKDFVQMFGKYNFGKDAKGKDIERGGLLAKRVEAMVEAYEDQVKYRKGEVDEKSLRNSAGIVSTMLMRGATVEAEAFAKSGAVSMAGDRGPVTSFLNNYFSHDTSAVVGRSGTDRRGGFGAAKVLSENPESAAGQDAANLSPVRVAALARAGFSTDAADKFTADFTKSLFASATWPSGESMCATISSIKRKDGTEVSQPTHTEIDRVFRAGFADPADPMARAAITTGDKTEGGYAFQWPKTLMKELTGVDKPTYYEFYKAAAILVGADKTSPKRTALFLAQGRGISVMNPRMGLDLGEELVGDSMLAGVLAKAAQLGGSRENNKAHLASVMNDGSILFIKAKQQISPTSGRAVLKDVSKAMSEAAKEFKLLDFLDMDSLKESDLLSKDAMGRTAISLFAGGEVDAEVKLPGGGTTKVSDLVKKYDLKLEQRKVGDTTKPLIVVTVPGTLKMQYAANVTKPSKPGNIDLYTDFVRALVSPSSLAAHAQLAGAYLGRPGVKAAMEAKAVESLAASDPWLAELIEAGATMEDPNIKGPYSLKMASALKAEMSVVKAYGNKYIESSNGRTAVKDSENDPVFVDGERWIKVSDAYGAAGLVQSGDTGHDPVALVHNAIAYTPEEAKRKGRPYMPSAVQVNNTAPGFRYALRADAKIGPSELRERLIYCHGAMQESLAKADPQIYLAKADPQIYLAAYMDSENGLNGVFLNPDGTPVPPGSLYNIGDLFDASGKIDLSAFYDGKDIKTDAKGEAYILLRGEFLAGSRTPLDNPSSYRLLSAAEPATQVKADKSGRYKYRAAIQLADGSYTAEMVPYPEGTLVPGPDAHIRMNEGDALLSGGDHDGDMGGLVQFRADKYGRLQTEAPEAADKVAKSSDDADAKKIYTASAEAAANKMVQEAIGKMAMRSTAKDLARTGGKRGHALFNTDPIRSTTKLTETRAKTGVTESPLLKGGRSERGALVKPDLTNPDSAAKFTTAASDNANMGRSSAVSAAAALLIAHDHGVSLKAFTRAQTFLTVPDTLSEQGVMKFYEMFGADPAKDASWDDARWTEFMNFAARSKNITFDDLKEGIMAAAEVYPAIIDMYMYMGYNSGARSRAEYDDFHLLWVEWARSPEGREWLKAYANALDPEGNGGAGYRADLDARIKAMRDTDRSEFTVMDGLMPAARSALAAVSMARGPVTQESVEKIRPLADLFRGMSAMASVKRAYDWKKLDAAREDSFDSAVKAVEALNKVLSGDSSALQLTGDGKELAAAANAASLWVGVMSGVHAGNVRAAEDNVLSVAKKTPRLEIVDKGMQGIVVSVPETKMAADEAVKFAVDRHFAWLAAKSMTPEDTQAKIDQIVAGDNSDGRPMRFVTTTEYVLGRMFRSWSKQLMSTKGRDNGVFGHLLPPSDKNMLSRIALMGSLDAADARAVVGEGLNDLRDWTSAQDWVRPVSINFKSNGAEASVLVTPADMYWMLLQYATLTGGKALDAGRAKQSLVPLFGAKVFADLGAAQVRFASAETGMKEALEAVTASVFGKGTGRSGTLVAAGGYDTRRFAAQEIDRRVRVMQPREEEPKNLVPAVAPLTPPAAPNFEKIAPVAEVKEEVSLPAFLDSVIDKRTEYEKANSAEVVRMIREWPDSVKEELYKRSKQTSAELGMDFEYATVDQYLAYLVSPYRAMRGFDVRGSLDEMTGVDMAHGAQLIDRVLKIRGKMKNTAAVAAVGIEVVKLGFNDTPPDGVVSGMRRGHITMANAFPADYGKPNSGWLGNPYKWSGNGGSGTVEQAIASFRDAFLAKIKQDPAFKEAVEGLRGKKLGYYRPQGEGQSGKHHLQVVQEYLGANAPAAVKAVQASNFLGYKGGFENAGKGTPDGDGKDKAMRKVADSAVVELDGRNRESSSRTSSEVLGKPDENSQVVMLARNGSLSGKPLRDITKNTIRDLHENLGVKFVVGDMPGVDSAFIDFLQEIGASFEIYHTGSFVKGVNPRIQVESTGMVVRDASGKAVQTEASSAVLHLNQMLDHAATQEAKQFRIPARINGEKPVRLPFQEEAASASALAFERIAGLPWMSKLTMAQGVLQAAASATRELGYVDPAVTLGSVMAMGRDAYLKGDKDAVSQVLGMMARAGRYDFAKKVMPETLVDMKRVRDMAALGEKVRDMTPRAVLSEYILAADPRKVAGVTGADVERAIWGELSYSLASDELEEETLAVMRKYQPTTPGLALRHAQARLAYDAALKVGVVDERHPAYVEFKKTSDEMMADKAAAAKAMVQRDDRDGHTLTRVFGSDSAVATLSQSGEKESNTLAENFEQGMNALVRAADSAQEEVTRGSLSNDDRVKAYAGKLRSQHNKYWYEGTAPRHAELLVSLDAGAALVRAGAHVDGALADVSAQITPLVGNKAVITRINQRIGMLRKILSQDNGGSLPDPRNVRGDAYGKLMESLGQHQSGIAADTKSLMDEAKALGTPEGDAIAEQADDAYFGVASALRVARSVISRRQFGEAGVQGIEDLTLVDGTALEPVVAKIDEVSLADPDTGMPDASDDFNVAMHDTDYWIATTYLPSFQGVPLRDILKDKEPLAVIHRFVAMSNSMEAKYGVDSDTGSLRVAKKVKGGGHKLQDGGYVYDRTATAAEVTRYGRRKTAKELADVIGGGAFTAQEYALARWFAQAIYVWAGDGGYAGRQTLGNTVDLYDLNWGDSLRDTIPAGSWGGAAHKTVADAMRKLSEERINQVGGKRPFALDKLVQALDNNLPEALRDRAISELVLALETAAKMRTGAQGAMAALAERGWLTPRTRAKPDINGNPTTVMEIYDGRFAVPVKATEEAFLASTAHKKLVAHGRDPADLTLAADGQRIRDEVLLAKKSFRNLSFFTDGDGRMFAGGPQAPVTRGSGFFQYHARKRLAEVTPEYRAKVNEAYASLKEALDACLDRKEMRMDEIKAENAWLKVEGAAGNSKFSRMFALFRDLAGGFEGTERPEVVAQMITSDRKFAHHGEGFGTGNLEMRELAKAIYSLTVRKLHESAWDAGLSKALTAEEAGYEAFNTAMEDSASEHSADVGRAGSTFSEVYNLTGALPANLTAGEAMAKFATETATAMRYRGAVNQALLSTDENGMPLVYMEPGDGADDTVPDVVWQAAARMWVRAAGRSGDVKVTYDESRTGKENAKRLYPVMVDGKVGQGATRQASGGLDRYILSDVKVPPGIAAVKRCAAMKDPRGDDTYGVANVFAGGEAAGYMEQLFAISGFNRTDLMIPQISRVLSWSKSLSVMNSLFFPIATAFESPVAAVGIWPTIFGLTSKGSDFFRKAAEGGGALAKTLKAGGVDLDAPGMRDIMKMIGSDDPALVDMKMHATLSGLSLADRSRNVTDHDRMALAKDVKAITGMVRQQYGDKAASAMKGLMEGVLEHSSEFAFEYVINATKIAVFAQMNNRLRNKALAAGRWWDPVRSMRRWAGYINAEVGGIDTATVAAMTPRMQNWLKGLMFSWEWTLGAWLAGGGGVLTQKFFGMTTSPHDRGFMFGRWARMYGTIMLGLPVTMQMVAMAIAKAGGDDDEDDKWFNWQNEKGRSLHDFDITPLLRHIGNSSPLYIPGLPAWSQLKEKLPSTVAFGNIPVGALIPGLTGDEGDMVSSRKRRYYMHLGKQGWEVAGWFENPMQSLLGKMSMPAQRGLEGILGVTPSTGWAKPFAEMGFWERWLSLDGEKSALLNMLGSFTPFSYASMARAPEAGIISAVGPIGKGMSATRAVKEMEKMFNQWADADSYAAVMKGEDKAWTDLKSMAAEWLDALRQNGYEPEIYLKAALAKSRKPLYDQVHAALPRIDGQPADMGALERAARGLNRLDYIYADLMKSVKAKDKNQNITRTKGVRDISNAAIRESFADPYGRGTNDVRKAQSADLGGDVTAFLATDEIPETVLGYRVVPQNEMTEKDLAFFRESPSAAGFFRTGKE